MRVENEVSAVFEKVQASEESVESSRDESLMSVDGDFKRVEDL